VRQLKAIFTKTGAHWQSELTELLAKAKFPSKIGLCAASWCVYPVSNTCCIYRDDASHTQAAGGSSWFVDARQGLSHWPPH
jgi:hypothetical protein